MIDYIPDAWVIVEMNSAEHGTVHKVLAGWYGGFAGADEWKLSSGIKTLKMEDDIYVMEQESGSVYGCHPASERMSGLMHSTFNRFSKKIEESGVGTMKVIGIDEILDIYK